MKVHCILATSICLAFLPAITFAVTEAGPEVVKFKVVIKNAEARFRRRRDPLQNSELSPILRGLVSRSNGVKIMAYRS